MVAPDKQSNGVGKSIIDKLIAHGFANGNTRYELEVKDSNERAIRFYRKKSV